MLPSHAVNNYYNIIIMNVYSIHRLHYVWFQNNPGQVNNYVCTSYSVNSNAHMMPSEFMVNPMRINSAQSIFFGISPSNITRCQVPSRVRAWFHDSEGDIDFYQMSLSQSESTILHESIIL